MPCHILIGTNYAHTVYSFIHLFHWHVHNATIPCHSQELLPFLSVMYLSCHPSPQTILYMLYKISLSCLYGKAVTRANFYALFSHLLIQIKSSFPPLYSTKILLYSTSIKQRNHKWMSEHVKMMNDVGGNSNINIPMSSAMFGSTCTEISTRWP
jgi:hypothetical protein